MTKKQESWNHGKNSTEVTISIPTALHQRKKVQDWQAWNSFDSSSSLSIPIITPKGLMRKPVLHLVRQADRQAGSETLGAVHQTR